MAVRFDPSYYYGQGRPEEIASRLAERWRAAGINRVYCRLYDPRHGAFYRTRYDLNSEGDFGRYDLLSRVLDECEERRIEVFGWIQVMNHAGAWEARPEWRARNLDGTDYSDTGLQFPLCARNPEARKWWIGFLDDVLRSYPRLAGIDLGEPVIRWRGDACACPLCREALGKAGSTDERDRIRSQALTELIQESIGQIHRARRRACVTTVWSAADSGNLADPKRFAALTGFDLFAIIHGKDDERPDVLCPEFLWQEWQSRTGRRDLFAPEWCGRALRQFLSWIDTPVEVVAHVEITSFPGVEVGRRDLAKSIRSALAAGATGIDVYDAKQLDDLDAWSVISQTREATPRKRCLVLHDGPKGESDAIQVGELLRHFRTEVSLLRVDDFPATAPASFDNIFYVGSVADRVLPGAFLSSVSSSTIPICWLGNNIERLLETSPSLGLRYVKAAENVYRRVRYKDTDLAKEDPWTQVVEATDPRKCRVLAVAVGPDGSVPYAVRSGRNFWYFADVPPNYAIEGGRFLVFADLLHDILNEDHEERRLALVRIEDVHPLTDPLALRRIADILHKERVPFLVSLVPVYVYPEMNEYARLSDKPEFVDAVKYMVKKGGTVVLHGDTHQRFSETTADYEFWDPLTDAPPEGMNEASLCAKIEDALRECWSRQIYPLMWETPHYAGPQQLYRILPRFFSIAMERRQSIDKTGSDQYLPYLIRDDRFGQTIVPENMGYVPMDNAVSAAVLDPARKMDVVRDGVVSFFFHPFIDPGILREIARELKRSGRRFATVGDLPIRVRTSFGIVTNEGGRPEIRTDLLSGYEAELAFPGVVSRRKRIAPRADGRYEFDASVRPGGLFAAVFINRYAKDRTRATESVDEDSRVLRQVTNHFGETCESPVPLLLADANSTGGFRNEILGFESLFRTLGIDVRKEEVAEFRAVPASVNLLLVPAAAGGQMTLEQVAAISQAVLQGRVSLIASGFGPLADEIGIERLRERIEVSQATDLFYPDVEIRWKRPVATFAFESPGDASFMYEDAATHSPLVVSASHGEGRFVFLGAPLDEETPFGSSRYPHFAVHAFRSLGLFPQVRRAGIETYFNPAERGEEVSIEDLVKRWRRSGVRVLYVAAWHAYAEWTYNYARLIELAHTNAMSVYAWIAPPYVSEKFWADHPEWREKNARGEDVVAEWRKPMAWGDPAARKGSLDEIERILTAYDWDGVAIERVGWDGAGPEDPATFCPFDSATREAFRRSAGFDPVEILNPASARYWQTDREALDAFLRFRSESARAQLDALLSRVQSLRQRGKSYGETVVTYHPGDKWCGIDIGDLRTAKKRYDFSLQSAPESDGVRLSSPEGFDLTQVSLSPAPEGQTFDSIAPTRYPTGLALYTRLGVDGVGRGRFTLKSESAVYEIDMGMLPFVCASKSRQHWAGDSLILQSPYALEASFARIDDGRLLLDGLPAASFFLNRLLVPAGEHEVSLPTPFQKTIRQIDGTARLVDCSGDLLDSEIVSRGVRFDYSSRTRAHAVVSEKPRSVSVDGKSVDFRVERGLLGWSIALPPGRHTATVATRSYADYLLSVASLFLSNAIVLVSVLSIAALAAIFVVVRARRKAHERRT